MYMILKGRLGSFRERISIAGMNASIFYPYHKNIHRKSHLLSILSVYCVIVGYLKEDFGIIEKDLNYRNFHIHRHSC